MIYNKKGDMSLLFKWLFGVVSGAVFLAFFVRFSTIHLEGEGLLEGNKMLVYVDDKLDAFGVGEGSDVFDLKDDFSFNLECGKISIDNEKSGRYFERDLDKIIFSPQKIEGDEINVWTNKWEFPYGIVTFYYLNNKESRVLLLSNIYNQNDVIEFAQRIPGNMNFQTTSVSSFIPEVFASQVNTLDKITLVYFGTPTYNVQQLQQVFENNVEIIEVNLVENTAKIYDAYGSVEEVFYLEEEMLYGLIFSGSGYTCVKDLVLERFRVLTSIYLNKIERLMGKTNEQRCVDLLNEARNMLETYSGVMSKTEFYNYNERIKRQNRHLETSGCSVIYQ